MATAPTSSTSCGRASPSTPRASGLSAEPDVVYRPRSKAATEEELAAELAERARVRPGARLHRATGRTATTSSCAATGRELRAYGSRGQQRLGLLALLLAEREALAESRGTPPLMLLDDVMSELDAGRRGRLVDVLRARGQSLITTTDLAHVPGGDDAGRDAAGDRRGRRPPGGGVKRRSGPRPLALALDALTAASDARDAARRGPAGLAAGRRRRPSRRRPNRSRSGPA